jgi:hypothetical protein
MEINERTIDALRCLREVAAHSREIPSYVRAAINVLDEADVFDEIDAVADGKADIRRPPTVTEPLQSGEFGGLSVSMAYVVHHLDGRRDVPRLWQSAPLPVDDVDRALVLAQEQLVADLRRIGHIERAGQVEIISAVTNPVLCG